MQAEYLRYDERNPADLAHDYVSKNYLRIISRIEKWVGQLPETWSPEFKSHSKIKTEQRPWLIVFDTTLPSLILMESKITRLHTHNSVKTQLVPLTV